MKLNKSDLIIPCHVAIILDGNGRWAKQKGLIRSLGHKAGAETLKNIVTDALKIGIKVLSVFCFSTENWKRNKEETDYLFTLPKIYFEKYGDDLLAKDIKVTFSGDITSIPQSARLACEAIKLKTSSCNSFTLNICLNYGGKDDIVNACKKIASKIKNGELNINEINEKEFEKHLYTKDLPPVDLLIRTSNEKRLSNFMMYQLAYSELYFTKTLWPSFNFNSLMKAIKDYNSRERRFGGVKK